MVPLRWCGGGSHGRSDDAGLRLLRSAVLLIAVLAAESLHAASARFTRISVEQGLSQSSVEVIAEDRFGFLWFGTQEGLSRFDGYRFTVYQGRQSPGHLRDSFVRAIVPDGQGDLWIGTESTVQHLDVETGRFGDSIAPPGIGVRLNTLREAADGRMWFGGLYGGLWTRGPQDAGPARRVAEDAIGPADIVTALNVSREGVVWLSSKGRLYSIAPRQTEARLVIEEAGAVRVIHVSEDGTLWIGRMDRPLLHFDPRSGAVEEFAELPRHVLAIASAGEGRLWVGVRDGGLTLFDPARRELATYVHEPGNQDSLAENDVASIHEDRGGSLWVGAWNGGLSRLNLYSQAFRTLRKDPARADSLPDNDVTRLTEDAVGQLWTISRNDVLSVGNPETGAFSVIPLQRDLTSIASAGGGIFVGTATGVVEIDPGTRRVTPVRAALRGAGLDGARIETIHGAGDLLWIVSGGKLYRLNAAAPAEEMAVAGLPSTDEPASMYAVSRERLWIAYSEGVLLLAETLPDGELKVRRVEDPSLTERGRLIAVMERRDVVWIGAAGGVARLRPGNKVEWLDLKKGMPSRSVAGILQDDLGMLWMAANRGITRYDPERNRAIHFGAAQGTQGSGYVDAGAARGASGRFYFAGRGITVFNPREVVENPYRPAVVFTALEILHRPVLPRWRDAESPLATAIHAAREVELGPDVVVFSVEMAAPGATDPESVVFAHKLEGFESEWIETPADRRVATYTRLSPGEYVLRARAQNEYGVWSAQETTLRIRVLPPWWRTPLALAVWIVVALLVIGGIIGEVRRRTRIRIALAEQEALRRASVTDPLTGLYNRRFVAEWVKHEVPRVLREHRVARSEGDSPELLHIVMADLDNLKDINDRAGHDAGDRVIRAVAELLQVSARAEDVAVRWGGDEFVLILRSRRRDDVVAAVERLRARAERLCDSYADLPACSLSIGFASFPFVPKEAAALTWEQTMQLADRALLQSKRRGRNVWTGFIARSGIHAAAVAEALASTSDAALADAVEVVEGPGGSVTRHDSTV